MSLSAAALVAVLAGLFIAGQAAVIGVLGRTVHPMTGAFWVHVGGAIFALVVVGVARFGFAVEEPRALGLGLLAGVVGVGIVTTIGIAVTPLGLGTAVVIITGTQLIGSLLLDAFGVTGRVIPLTVPRVGGVALMVAGALLVFGRTPS